MENSPSKLSVKNLRSVDNDSLTSQQDQLENQSNEINELQQVLEETLLRLALVTMENERQQSDYLKLEQTIEEYYNTGNHISYENLKIDNKELNTEITDLESKLFAVNENTENLLQDNIKHLREMDKNNANLIAQLELLESQKFQLESDLKSSEEANGGLTIENEELNLKLAKFMNEQEMYTSLDKRRYLSFV